MTSKESQILRFFNDAAKQAAAHHPGNPTPEEYAACYQTAAALAECTVEDVKRVVKDNAVKGAC